MCPGGYVVAAASEPGGVVTNGMSDHARDGENANAALLVTLNPADFPDSSPLGGMYWQRQIEQAAFRAGGSNYRAPAQLVGDFLKKQPSQALGAVQPAYRPGVTLCELHEVLPERITSVLEQALPELDKRLHGRRISRMDSLTSASDRRPLPRSFLNAFESFSVKPSNAMCYSFISRTARRIAPTCGAAPGTEASACAFCVIVSSADSSRRSRAMQPSAAS